MWFLNQVLYYSVQLLLAHSSCYISAEIWLLVTGMCGYLACFSLSCGAQLLRDSVLCAGPILCFGVLSALCHSPGLSRWSCLFSNHSLLHLASGSWQSLPEWMGLSMLCCVHNLVRGRSSSPGRSRRQDGFHHLWKAMVCGWACAIWNVSAEQGCLKAVTSVTFHYFLWVRFCSYFKKVKIEALCGLILKF